MIGDYMLKYHMPITQCVPIAERIFHYDEENPTLSFEVMAYFHFLINQSHLRAFVGFPHLHLLMYISQTTMNLLENKSMNTSPN